MDAQDGAGVKLKRVFPQPNLDNVDPFLLLDHFGSNNSDDFIAGFPLHPHRGIETVTYMLQGRVKHKDSTGHSGTISAGDVQWMSAGRGIMHEEMPEVADGKLDGFQLWVNLSAKDKMNAAAYQEYDAKQITRFNYQGHIVRLISGELLGHTGAVKDISTQPIYADISLVAAKIKIPLPATHAAFIYVFQGALSLINDSGEQQKLKTSDIAVLTSGSQLELSAKAPARIILIAGKPLNEPIVRSGPFVMNTKEQIQQTWRELEAGTFPPS